MKPHSDAVYFHLIHTTVWKFVVNRTECEISKWSISVEWKLRDQNNLNGFNFRMRTLAQIKCKWRYKYFIFIFILFCIEKQCIFGFKKLWVQPAQNTIF